MSSVFSKKLDFCLLLVYNVNINIRIVVIYMAAENFKEIFARNLNYYMKKNNIKQIDLVNRFNVSKSTVSGWCNGIKIPRMDKIELLSELFGISKSALIEAKVPNNVTLINDEKLIAVPVIKQVTLDKNCFSEDNIAEYKYISADDITADQKYVFLRVKGDNMYPNLIENDLALVRCQEYADSGAIAVAVTDSEGWVVKKIVSGNNFIELHSINPMYPVRRFENDDMTRVHIFGTVCRVIREF